MACADMIIVFSGFRDDVLKTQIEAADGKVVTSLVKTATHLLAKKDSKASKKIEEAKEKGLTVLYLDEFIEEHGFSLAEKKPRAKKPEPEIELESDAPVILKKTSDIDLVYRVMHALVTGQNKDDALDALGKIRAILEA